MCHFYHCLVGVSFVFLQNSLTSRLHHFIDSVFKCIWNPTASHKPLFQLGPSTTISCLCGLSRLPKRPPDLKQFLSLFCSKSSMRLPSSPPRFLLAAGSSRLISSVQSLSHVLLFATPWTAARQASLSITNCQSPPKLMSIESVMPSSHLILCCPLLLPPSIFPGNRVFSNDLLITAGKLSCGTRDPVP